MSCTSPIPAIDFGIDPITGKHRIKIKYPHVDESFEEFKHKYSSPCSCVVLLPCGHCLACKMSKRREWAVRCAMEAKYHAVNCFVTLTYDDDHIVDKVQKSHLQAFFKNIRNAGYKVRYFACGEYGENTNRPHYHAVLFGYLPNDLHLAYTSGSGNAVYYSEELASFWKYGLAVVQYFDAKCGSYVAGYTSKKLGDDDGFIMMSKRPGLGYQYLFDHKLDIAELYKIVDDFGSIKETIPPRYFDKIAEKEGVDLSSIKADVAEFSRIIRAVKFQKQKVNHINEIFKNQRFFDKQRFSKLRRDAL